MSHLNFYLQVARMVSNYFKEQEQKGLKAEKEEAIKLKKIASHMAKMVKEFWNNIEKVTQLLRITKTCLFSGVTLLFRWEWLYSTCSK